MFKQATGFVIDRKGVIITGAPGIGKTSLMLAAYMEGGFIIGDDGLEVSDTSGQLFMHPVTNFEGLVHVRGMGIYKVPFHTRHQADVHVQLLARSDDELPPNQLEEFCSVALPVIRLVYDSYALHRLRFLLRHERVI